MGTKAKLQPNLHPKICSIIIPQYDNMCKNEFLARKDWSSMNNEKVYIPGIVYQKRYYILCPKLRQEGI
nr:MAG TPA: hypothetical protein [Caudoviricetes sp.]